MRSKKECEQLFDFTRSAHLDSHYKDGYLRALADVMRKPLTVAIKESDQRRRMLVAA